MNPQYSMKSSRRNPLVLGLCVLLLTTQAFAQSSRPGWGAIVFRTATGTGVTFRVWAPNATSVQVAGDFSCWNNLYPPLEREGTSGVWSADYPEIPEGAAEGVAGAARWVSVLRPRSEAWDGA